MTYKIIVKVALIFCFGVGTGSLHAGIINYGFGGYFTESTIDSVSVGEIYNMAFAFDETLRVYDGVVTGDQLWGWQINLDPPSGPFTINGSDGTLVNFTARFRSSGSLDVMDVDIGWLIDTNTKNVEWSYTSSGLSLAVEPPTLPIGVASDSSVINTGIHADRGPDDTVPEPTTLVLMSLGLAGICYRQRKAV